MKDRKPELLSPAGSFSSLCAAVDAGADAVYTSGRRFGARAYAENLSETELARAIDYVHLHGRKIYLTVNTLLKEREMGELFDYLLPYYGQGLDAVIVQDIGVFSFLRRQFPELPVHISTQMSLTASDGISFFARRGASRIILPRELTLAEIREIRSETDRPGKGLVPELECFVHGSLCYCYSGQCLLSSLIGGRSGNRGQCAGPCRLFYQADGHGSDKKPQTWLSLKDLCAIEHLPDLIEAGIDSFKIEGRMKQPSYVYTVTALYRKYLDLYFADNENKKADTAFRVTPQDLHRLQAAYQRRGYTDGYYFRRNGREMISFDQTDPAKMQGRSQNVSPEDQTKNANHLQEKINGKLMLSEGSRATLYLECGQVSVTCSGDVVQKAISQPLTPAQARKQMTKTGDCAFTFQDLQVEISGSVFLPVKSLNALRREALCKLEEAMLLRYHRDKVKRIPQETFSTGEKNAKTKLSVFVSSVVQLQAALDMASISRIYVDAEIAFTKEVLPLIRKDGPETYLAMPYVFREETRQRFSELYELITTTYQGILVRSWDAYAWLLGQGYDKDIVADQNLYVFNTESIHFLDQAGLSAWTAPAELNARELDNLGIEGQSLVVYGYQPVMVSANCIRKSGAGCRKDGKTDQEDSWMTLQDEHHHRFAVKMVCPWCYNVIYNTVPLVLLDQKDEIRKLDPGFLRLDFTTESGAQTKNWIESYTALFLPGEEEGAGEKPSDPDLSGFGFTRGHFKRGVT